jgi:hypothetical protein
MFAAWLAGCADVPSTAPTPPTYVSQYRFIHAATDLGNVGVAVDGAVIGSVDYQGVIPYKEFPSGSRVAVLSNGDTLRIGLPIERRGSIVLLARSGAARDIINLAERRVFDAVATTNALVRVVNASAIDGLDVLVAAGADTAIAESGLGLRGDTGYEAIPVGSYTLSVVVTGDTTNTVVASATLNAANKRQTSLIVGSQAAGNLAIINLSDD